MTKRIASVPTLIALSTGLFVSTAVAESFLEKWPIGLICERPDETVVIGYLSAVTKEGIALYQSTGAGRAVTVTPDGVIEKTPTTAEGLSCVGRTVEEWRQEGNTIEALRSGN